MLGLSSTAIILWHGYGNCGLAVQIQIFAHVAHLETMHRDIITIGALSGGLEALTQIAAGLASDLPAAVFVVMHMHETSPYLIPLLLSRVSALPVRSPADGSGIEPRNDLCRVRPIIIC